MIQIEHARTLVTVAAIAQARELLVEARNTAAALGLHGLTRKVVALEAEIEERERSALQMVPGMAQQAGGGRGRVVPFARPATRGGGAPNGQGETSVRGAPAPPASRTLCATLRRDGRLWTIACGGVVLRCKSSKGLHYLAHLLRNPGRSFHVLELVALDEPAAASASEVRHLSRAQLEQLGLHVGQPQMGEPIADAKALGAYRSRIEDLTAELTEATQFNDLARRTRLQEEIDLLTEALARAIGLGGRTRASGSFAERARLNVTRAVRSAIQRIGEGHPELGSHLDRNVHTGTFCRYGPAEEIQWEL
jgi:non-specific serine/threonine protein kinase